MVRLNLLFLFVLFFLQVHCQNLSSKSGFFNKYVGDFIAENNFTYNTCIKDIFGVIKAINQKEIWAVKMVDAAAKIQSGLLEGNMINLGSYDQCLAVQGKIDDQIIRGKYCLPIIYLPQVHSPSVIPLIAIELVSKDLQANNLAFLHAMCVPDSCTSENLNQIFNNSVLTDILSVETLFLEKFCSVQQYETKYTTLDYIFLVLITLTFFLLIFCTIYDLYLQKLNKKPLHAVMISFSLYTNIKQLIKIKKDPDQLSCVHGIRVLSMAWIVLGHKFMMNCFYPHDNYLYSLQWLQENTTAFAIGALYAVDTFLLLSGMLIMYVVLLAKSKKFQFNLIYYYIHRIFRLSPPLAMMILFYMTFLRTIIIGTGPLSNVMFSMLNESCNNYWWATILFLQNILSYGDICIAQTWYLATDTQLYLVAPLLFIPIQKRPKTMLFVIIILLISSIVSTFVITWNMKLSVSVVSIASAFRDVYMSPVVRSNAWLIGSLLGYILFKCRNNKVIISQLAVYMIWILTICVMIWLMYLQIYFNKTPYNEVTASLFHMFARPLWSLCISWIIFACTQGYSRLTNIFLSNKVFVILGRLSYCMYLTHIMVIFVTIVKRKTMTTFTNFDTVSYYWSDFLYTIIISFVWTLCFESPIIALGKALMPEYMSNKLKKINEENEKTYDERNSNRQHITRL